MDAYADVNAIPYEVDCFVFGKTSFDQARGPANRTAMRLAFERGFLHIVELLSNSGAYLSPPSQETGWDIEKWDPLFAAIQSRNEDVVRFVLREMYNDASHRKRTAGDAVKDLLALGRLSSRTTCRLVVMCTGICSGNNVMVEQALFEMTALSGNIENGHGTRILILAVRERREDLIKPLLIAGISPYDCLELGREDLEDLDEQHMFWRSISAFEIAMEWGRTNIVRKFLDFKPKSLSNGQLLSRDRNLSASYTTALQNSDDKLRSLISDAWLSTRSHDHYAGGKFQVQQRFHSALQQAKKTQKSHRGSATTSSWCQPRYTQGGVSYHR